MWLLPIAAFGILVPNGLFVYWLVHEFSSIDQVFSDKLALGFIIDLFVALGVLTYLFAIRPVGPVRWPWFLLLSLIGGLGFSIPLYLWLNWRASASTGLPVSVWWKSV